jgi:hypothetical protein
MTPDSFYLGTTNLFLLYQGIRQTDSEQLAEWKEIDIVYNRLFSVSGPKNIIFELLVAQGILDTNAESAAMGHNFETHANVANLYAVSNPKDWALLQSENDLRVANISLSTDLKARIMESLARGKSVIVPKKNVTLGNRFWLGWWEIDPNTGETIGTMANGRGSVSAETLLTIYTWAKIGVGLIVSVASCQGNWHCIGCVVAVIAVSAAYGLALPGMGLSAELAFGYSLISDVLFFGPVGMFGCSSLPDSG